MTTFADSVLAAVVAAVPGDVHVYDTMVDGVPPARYVLLFIPGGLRSMTAIDNQSDHLSLHFDVMTVVASKNGVYAAPQCRALASRVRDALTDHVVTATGWRNAQIKHAGSRPPAPDETTPNKKVFCTDQFELESGPA